MYMNNSDAAKMRTGKTSEERSERMREVARQKWIKISPEERLKHAMKMVDARKNKFNNNIK